MTTTPINKNQQVYTDRYDSVPTNRERTRLEADYESNLGPEQGTDFYADGQGNSREIPGEHANNALAGMDDHDLVQTGQQMAEADQALQDFKDGAPDTLDSAETLLKSAIDSAPELTDDQKNDLKSKYHGSFNNLLTRVKTGNIKSQDKLDSEIERVKNSFTTEIESLVNEAKAEKKAEAERIKSVLDKDLPNTLKNSMPADPSNLLTVYSQANDIAQKIANGADYGDYSAAISAIDALPDDKGYKTVRFVLNGLYKACGKDEATFQKTLKGLPDDLRHSLMRKITVATNPVDDEINPSATYTDSSGHQLNHDQIVDLTLSYHSTHDLGGMLKDTFDEATTSPDDTWHVNLGGESQS